MRPLLVPVLLAPLTPLAACIDVIDAGAPIVCDDAPPVFGAPVVAARMPAAITLARAVLADDRTILVWAEAGAPGQSFVRARCLGPDGAALPVDVAIAVDGYVSTVEVAPAAGGDGYHVVYGAWAATDANDPVSVLSADLDCAGSEPVPRQILPARRGGGAWALIAAGDAYAFLVTGDGTPSLAIERGDEVVVRALGAEWGTLAYHDGEIAAVALVPAGASIATYGLDGAPRAAAVALPGTTGAYAGAACWDGGGWSVVANTRRDGRGEIVYTRRAAYGTPPLPAVTVSDGTGQSYDPAIACGDGGAAIAFRRNAPGSVPGTDLVVSSIRMLEVAVDGRVRHPAVELEPVGPRLAMFPTVATGTRLVATWTAYDAKGYEQRWAATGDRCDGP